ncbi:hypothetical protein GJ496_006444 [Pomphorhynchus laevis]|nr:hypothetical protein GJ496_006444 [Pomphorhynchus laevis]
MDLKENPIHIKCAFMCIRKEQTGFKGIVCWTRATMLRYDNSNSVKSPYGSDKTSSDLSVHPCVFGNNKQASRGLYVELERQFTI